jgi:hypothetical protein
VTGSDAPARATLTREYLVEAVDDMRPDLPERARASLLADVIDRICSFGGAPANTSEMYLG